MIVLNDLYDYGYKIYQDNEYFKFNLDSILLAEFVKYKKNDQVLDLCTGNLVIPLILHQKEKTLKIDGIEIQEKLCELGKKSIKINKISNSINIYNNNIKDINFKKKYDIITCNPPYFKNNNISKKNKEIFKTLARHEIELDLDDIIEISSKYLKEKGNLYLIQRCERLVEVIEILNKYKLGIRKIVFIETKENKNSKIFLINAAKNKKNDPKIYNIKINNNQSYKNIFKEI